MSVWEFTAAIDGFAEFNGAKKRSSEVSDVQLKDMGIEGFEDG